MHDTLTPNVLKVEFSRKVIQLKALVALSNTEMRKNPEKQLQLLLVTAGGTITGDYCELYCSDDLCCKKTHGFDISSVDELANKVLIDAENELVNIRLTDNAEFIKLKDVTITNSSHTTEVEQLLVYADQIIAFSIVEK